MDLRKRVLSRARQFVLPKVNSYGTDLDPVLLIPLVKWPRLNITLANHEKMNRLKELEAFVAIADAGSLSRAAADLDLSVATMSRLLNSLETRLQVRPLAI